MLIDFLGNKILNMKIEDIKGKEVQQGNITQIKTFLELILALSNVESGEEETEEHQIKNKQRKTKKSSLKHKHKENGFKNKSMFKSLDDDGHKKTLKKRKKKFQRNGHSKKTITKKDDNYMIEPRFIESKQSNKI